MSKTKPRAKCPFVRVTLQQKREIIRSVENGEPYSKIGQRMNIQTRRVRAIWEKRDDIKKYLKVSGPNTSSLIVSNRRPAILDLLEVELYEWAMERKRNGLPITEPVIQKQARLLFYEYEEKSGVKSNFHFQASAGWFKRFRDRFNLNGKAKPKPEENLAFEDDTMHDDNENTPMENLETIFNEEDHSNHNKDCNQKINHGTIVIKREPDSPQSPSPPPQQIEPRTEVPTITIPHVVLPNVVFGKPSAAPQQSLKPIGTKMSQTSISSKTKNKIKAIPDPSPPLSLMLQSIETTYKGLNEKHKHLYLKMVNSVTELFQDL